MPNLFDSASRIERRVSHGSSEPADRTSMWRPRIQSVFGFALLIGGMVMIAYGGLEAAVAPRIHQVFAGPAPGPSTSVGSFALGAGAIVAGAVFLFLSSHKQRPH